MAIKVNYTVKKNNLATFGTLGAGDAFMMKDSEVLYVKSKSEGKAFSFEAQDLVDIDPNLDVQPREVDIKVMTRRNPPKKAKDVQENKVQ